jgi:hypothetical protein
VPCASGDGFMSKRNNVEKLVVKSTKFPSSRKSGHTTLYCIRFLFLEHSRQHFRTKQTPNFFVEWLAFFIFIREVPSLNLGSETCYSKGYRSFYQGIYLPLDHDRFLSQPHFVIHWSVYRQTLCGLSSWWGGTKRKEPASRITREFCGELFDLQVPDFLSRSGYKSSQFCLLDFSVSLVAFWQATFTWNTLSAHRSWDLYLKGWY